MKNVKNILDKHPDHPGISNFPYNYSLETLAMQALTMNALKRKTEAFDLIKKALFKNLANFTCWHVFGILHRSNKYSRVFN